MKQTALIITEDLSKTQILGGLLGRLYSFIFIGFLKIKISLVIFFLYRKYDLNILATDGIISNKKLKIINYSQELPSEEWKKLRLKTWKLTKKSLEKITNINERFFSFKNINLFKLWETTLAIKILFNYLFFSEIIEKKIKELKPSCVVILSNSRQDKISRFLANQYRLRLINLSFFNLAFINKRLIRFFRERELKNKILYFVKQNSFPKPKIIKKENNILLACDFFRHIKTLVPIYEYYKHSKQFQPWFITNIPNFINQVNKFNNFQPNNIFIASFFNKKLLKKSISQWIKEINKTYSRAEKIFTLDMLTDQDYLLKYIFEDLSPIIKYGTILSKLYLEAGYNLLKSLQPKGIIVLSDQRLIEVSLGLLAKELHINSVLVSPHTVLSADQINRYNITNRICVPGKYSYQNLLKLGISKSKLIISGEPQFDYCNNQVNKINLSNIFNKLNISKKNKQILLLASFPSNWSIPLIEKKIVFKTIYSAIERLSSKYLLIIKPHPGEDRNRLLQELKEWKISNVIVTDNTKIELFELLHISDVVAITWSMMGLEAIMYNKPVIVVNPLRIDYDQYIPYVADGGGIQTTSINDLVGKLISLSENKQLKENQLLKARKFISRYILPSDGNTCNRINSALFSCRDAKPGSIRI
ncbi:UDP-N-acetylglucosamine 2-epimerase [Patescibacteria group bacterium]|nr:UDP-N-acetylglucosamine 2-epimerase [Patescibacteria group bacterium]